MGRRPHSQNGGGQQEQGQKRQEHQPTLERRQDAGRHFPRLVFGDVHGACQSDHFIDLLRHGDPFVGELTVFKTKAAIVMVGAGVGVGPQIFILAQGHTATLTNIHFI